MEVKVHIKGIENLKTATEIKVEKDKDGEEINRRLITKVQFECEIEPAIFANVYRLLANKVPLEAIIGSSQAVMEIVESKEPAFATRQTYLIPVTEETEAQISSGKSY